MCDALGLKQLGVELDSKSWIRQPTAETKVPGISAIGDAFGPSKSCWPMQPPPRNHCRESSMGTTGPWIMTWFLSHLTFPVKSGRCGAD